MVIVCVHAMLGMSRLGFVNRFSEATRSAVRLHCGVAAEGDLTLFRWSDECLHYNDEMKAGGFNYEVQLLDDFRGSISKPKNTS